MPLRLFPALLALLASVAACGGRRSDTRASVPVERVFHEDERSPQKSEGHCQACNMDVYGGHRCGMTTPCSLCRREQGADHLHEIAWVCSEDGSVTAEQHVCNDAKTCGRCRTDRRAHLGTRGCERCYRQAVPTKVRGITSYCQTCNQEVAANHLHGKTTFCRPCLREAGQGHRCDATRMCREHGREEATDHVHGTTEYCGRCHRESGPGHAHGVTEWCWSCRREQDWPHAHH